MRARIFHCRGVLAGLAGEQIQRVGQLDLLDGLLVGELLRLSLVERKGATLRVHRLVQDVVRARLSEAAARERLENAAALCVAVRDVEGDGAAHLVQLAAHSAALAWVPAGLVDALAEATAGEGVSPAGAAAEGRVVAVAGGKGGAGATSIALALALLGGVLLVDLSGSRASLAALLGCRVERSVADLAHVGEGLAAAIATAAVEHPCGLRLVPGPPGPEIAGTLPSGFAAALTRELRTAAPAVVDAGCAGSTAAREVAIAADRTLVVVTPDAYAVAAGRELVTTLARSGASGDSVTVVVNRWSRRSELSLRSIARTVGAPVAAAVGIDEGTMDAFANGRAQLERWPGRAHSAALRTLAAELWA